MEEVKDRRMLERISIDGAKICYRMQDEGSLHSRFSAPVPLSDLTWNSIRFEADASLTTGEIVDLQILIPGEKKIRVRGYLIWNSRSDQKEHNYVVVQLLPFGQGTEYNPVTTREALKMIINKFKSKSADF